MKILFATLPRYISRSFLYHFFFLLILLLFVVFIFDFIELLRRGADHNVSLVDTAVLGLLKLPEVGQIILPFAVLFSAMYTFWKLNRTSELAVMRASGMSALQFTFPMIFVAFCLGLAATMAINPLSALLLNKYEVLQNKLFEKTGSLVAVSESGLWLRQKTDQGYALINARKMDPQTWSMSDIILFDFDKNNNLLYRLEAEDGQLMAGYWQLNDVEKYTGLPRGEAIESIRFDTDLLPQDIIDTFSAADVISFWKLEEFISTLQATGFSTERLQVYYQSLLAKPFLFAAMILLAAAVSMRPARQGGTVYMVMIGVFAGFLIFFSDSVLQAFGISQKIPVFMAAWTPTIVSILLGGAMLLQQEDG